VAIYAKDTATHKRVDVKEAMANPKESNQQVDS
jgi:hypothetical protein